MKSDHAWSVDGPKPLGGSLPKTYIRYARLITQRNYLSANNFKSPFSLL